jgi:hypothetical protein
MARDSPRVSTDIMSEVFNLLDEQLDLRHSFPNVDEECQYRLRGMVPLQSPPCADHAPWLARVLTSPISQICFYACHYMAFFFNPKKRVWMTFDDASVTVLLCSFSSLRYQAAFLIACRC